MMNITCPAAITKALQDAGVCVVTHVPGSGASESFALLNAKRSKPFPLSLHEEVAFAIAHGAALAGKRSATLIKAHGFAKAANSVVDSLAGGTTAGFVAIVYDDPQAVHSDCIMNADALLKGIGMPVQDASAKSIYSDIIDAFRASEAMRLPVAIILKPADLKGETRIEPCNMPGKPPDYRRDIYAHLVAPVFASYQRRVLETKLAGRNWAEVPRPTVPMTPDDLPVVWQDTARLYVPLFEVFKKIRGKIVTGDPGVSACFAFPPFECVDTCFYMGGSVPMAIGAILAGFPDIWAVTGDFCFCAAGHLGLLEALYRHLPLKALVLNNGKAQATGGQSIPAQVLDAILSGYAQYVRRIRNPEDKLEIETVLREAQASTEMRIVLADYPQ